MTGVVMTQERIQNDLEETGRAFFVRVNSTVCCNKEKLQIGWLIEKDAQFQAGIWMEDIPIKRYEG